VTVTTETSEATGETATMTIVGALNSALELAMAADDKVILLGEDIADPAGGVFKVTKGLSTKFGNERVRATPIAETGIVGAAVGLALGGYRPVAEVMFMDFMTVCMDQVVNHAAKLRYMSGGESAVPLTIRTMIGVPRFGAQHVQSLEAWFMHIPGIKVVMPSTAADAKGLLTSCIADNDPCLFIESVAMAFAPKGEVPIGVYSVPLGMADVKRAGSDVTVVTYGQAVHTALAAAHALADEGISLEVIDLRTLVPLDMPKVLESVRKTTRAVVVHNATTFCGPGAEIATRITDELFDTLTAPVKRVGAAYSPAPYAPSGLQYLPQVDDVIEAVRALTGS
jgi:pyruvate/2-oxoglutarate/acetoin dehydrogenase E1 component